MVDSNDILRKIRYIFNYGDDQIIELFRLGDMTVSRSQLCDWLKRDDDPLLKPLLHIELAAFLNGFIASKRGKIEGKIIIPEKSLNNNIVLRKLKIALNLVDEELIEIFKLAGFDVSKHELSAFFRNPSHKQFRFCKDQFLRNFLRGMQIKYRDASVD